MFRWQLCHKWHFSHFSMVNSCVLFEKNCHNNTAFVNLEACCMD